MDYTHLVKLLRERMFLTQEQLAGILGVSAVTVNRWETGKFNPTIKMKKKLNDLFIEYRLLESGKNNAIKK